MLKNHYPVKKDPAPVADKRRVCFKLIRLGSSDGIFSIILPNRNTFPHPSQAILRPSADLVREYQLRSRW
jgi:hypothetical protein